ncbi:MAG: AAA family ATPase [Hyphomicrobiaceae bacterium]
MPKQIDNAKESYPEQHEVGYIGCEEIGRFVRRYKYSILAPVVLAVALALAYILSQKPTYTARTELLIDSQLPTSLRKQSGETAVLLDSAQIESQVMVLRSEAILTTVVRNLGLMDDPAYQNPNLNRPYLARIWRKPKPPSSEYERLRRGISVLQYGLDIRRIGLSYAIQISYRSHDPKEAARIANEVAQAFVQDQITNRSRAARQGSAWLETRIDELRHLMNSSAQVVQKFKAKRDYRIFGARASLKKATLSTKTDATATTAYSTHQTLIELESKANTYRKIYESFLEAYTESVQRQSFPVANARIITLATPPSSNSHPKAPVILLLGGTLGFILGVGIALLRYNTNQSVTSPKQARDVTGIQCLAQLPSVGKKIAPGGSLDQVTKSPFSRFSVEMNELKMGIELSDNGKAIGSLAVTSAFASSSKSTLVANLATIVAMSGTRVLIIDADQGFSTFCKTLTTNKALDLSEVITSSQTAEECILKCDSASVSILPFAGLAKAYGRDASFDWNMLPTLLRGLEQKFDLILFDMPCLQNMSEHRSVYAEFGGVLLTIEWGRTPQPLATAAVRLLETTHAKLIGNVITNAPSFARSIDRTTDFRKSDLATPGRRGADLVVA